jgi:hypothetical protein
MRFLALLALGVAVSGLEADARPKLLKNSLLSVAEPHPGEPANAHPHVNVIVLFGRLSDGTAADPATFKARIGRTDVTSDFKPMVDARGAHIGMRMKLDASRVKLGRRPRNVLRLSVQAHP